MVVVGGATQPVVAGLVDVDCEWCSQSQGEGSSRDPELCVTTGIRYIVLRMTPVECSLQFPFPVSCSRGCSWCLCSMLC